MFNEVIVGFDGSEQARDALTLAELLTAADGELVVCCVHRFETVSARLDPVEPREDVATAEGLAQEAVRLAGERVKVTTLLLPAASSAVGLQHAAEQRHAELIVLGSSHRGALGRVFLGSVTEGVLHSAPCAVAIAPRGLHARERETGLTHVTVAYDGEQQSGAALRRAAAIAREAGARLRVLQVVKTSTPYSASPFSGMTYLASIEGRLQLAREDVAAALAALPAGITSSSSVCEGEPTQELLDASHDTDLLVLGSHGHGPLRRLVLGCVSDAVVRGAACPVLIVP